MKTIKAFIKRYPLLSYFALTFALSWSGFLIAAGIGTGGFSPTPEELQTLVPYAVPAMLLRGGLRRSVAVYGVRYLPKTAWIRPMVLYDG
jgi:hypothetical protein